MNPLEALQLLDIAASRAPLTRDEHIQVRTAVKILAEAFSPLVKGPPAMDLSKLSAK